MTTSLKRFPNVLVDEQSMGPKNEHDLKVRVDEILKARKPMLWYLKVHGHPMQRAHVADYIGSYFGQAFAIEIKHPLEPKEPTLGQQKELTAFAKAGGKTLVANSCDEVTAFLEELRRRHYD